MRLVGPLLVTAALLSLAACEDEKKPAPGAAPSGTAAAPTSAESAAPAKSAAVTPTASASASAGPPMPPRPFPIGSSGPVQPSSPPELQVMAIAYTLAMVTPRGPDPLVVDKAYLEAIMKKLEAAVRTADKGKTPPNPVKTAKGDRKIEVLMGKGCTERVPSNLIAQRAGSSLKAAYEAGVLAISCHDDKWECHQSTRDANDVLCHAAPRH
jgi:hypothetical protein